MISERHHDESDARTKSLYRLTVLAAFVLLFTSLLCACTPTPDNTQIEDAIRASLAQEATPPKLDFSSMQVPTRSTGKASAVLWTADKTIQRNYQIEYIGKDKDCVVSSYSTSKLGEEGSYSLVANDLSLVPNEFANEFDFSTDSTEDYLMLYVGEGDNLNELKTTFERDRLANVSDEVKTRIELCDLGGNVLLLFVPRYKGLNIWINEIDYLSGSHIKSGEELARFIDTPFYLYCDFDDEYPAYEVHFAYDGLGYFIQTRESLLEQ